MILWILSALCLACSGYEVYCPPSEDVCVFILELSTAMGPADAENECSLAVIGATLSLHVGSPSSDKTTISEWYKDQPNNDEPWLGPAGTGDECYYVKPSSGQQQGPSDCSETRSVAICSYSDIAPKRKQPHGPVLTAVMKGVQKVSCTIIIVCLCISIGLFAMFRIFHFERLLQMGTEISLLAAHILILGFSEPETIKNDFMCDTAAFGLQMLFIGHFGFMFAEGLHSFSRLTNVISMGSFFKKWMYFAIIPGTSIAFSGINAALNFDEFDADLSCWIDLDHSLMFATLGPVTLLSLYGLGFAEAGGMHIEDPYPMQDVKKYFAAIICQKWLFLKILLSYVTFLLGGASLFYRHAALISTVSILHAILGICILVFHVSADTQVHKFAQKILNKIKRNNGKNSSNDVSMTDDE